MTAPSDNAAVLEVSDLSFSYGPQRALEGVGFAVRAGEFKVLLGPNGAGKTTLLSLITRLHDSASGLLRVAGADLRRHTGRALARMGVVFQQPALDLDLTVRQNLLYSAALHGMSRPAAQRRIAVELERMRLDERRDEKVRRLNSGHRRRVEIARALLHEPSLLVLDEPTVGLDVPTRHAIVEHVHALARERGTAVLWATHLIDEVGAGDSLIVLHRGRVRADGSVAEVVNASGGKDVAGAFGRLTGAPRP